MPTTNRSDPLIDPDCYDGDHGTCVGGPCECVCHPVVHQPKPGPVWLTDRKTLTTYALVAGAVAVTAFMIFIVRPATEPADDSAAHITACETAVGTHLRAPSGARYYGIGMADAKYGTVKGSVDAENGFGGHNAYSFMCIDSATGANVISLTQQTGITPSY